MILCVIVLLTNNVGTESTEKYTGASLMSITGILPRRGVSAYQLSGPSSGTHVMTEYFGPNATVRPTNHDHKQADRTKKRFI